MLNVENLSFRYSKFSRPVLSGASLELKAGEHELGMTVMYGSANLDALALIPVK